MQRRSLPSQYSRKGRRNMTWESRGSSLQAMLAIRSLALQCLLIISKTPKTPSRPCGLLVNPNFQAQLSKKC